MDSARRRKWRRVFFHHRIKQLTHSDRKVFSVPTLGCAQHPIGSRGASLDGTRAPPRCGGVRVIEHPGF
jgi:hypothetical protein